MSSDLDTLDIDGLGEVPDPNATREARDGRKQIADVSVPHQCPVTGCNHSGYESFAQLRGHFGNMADGAHEAYDLDISEFKA